MMRWKAPLALVAFAAAAACVPPSLASLSSSGDASELAVASTAGPATSGDATGARTLTVSLADGPSQVRRYQTCTWRAQASGGTGPYTYTWDAYPGATFTSYSYDFTGSTISSAGYTIEVTVTDANNATATQTRYIQVSTSAPATCWNP